nr:hypothetical protein [Cryobacterium algoritolerans]
MAVPLKGLTPSSRSVHVARAAAVGGTIVVVDLSERMLPLPAAE